MSVTPVSFHMFERSSEAMASIATALSGRVNTTYNLMCFAGAFAFQWGMGLLIDLLQAQGHDAATSYRYAFISLIACQFAAWFWLLLGRRRASAQI